MKLFAEEVMPVVRAEADTFLDDHYPGRTKPASEVAA